MSTEAKQLDVKTGDLVDIGGRQYDVVSDEQGGVALEPAIIKTVAEIHAEHGERQLSAAEVEELFGKIPYDGEGKAASNGPPAGGRT